MRWMCFVPGEIYRFERYKPNPETGKCKDFIGKNFIGTEKDNE
jgi:hypothetical protein